jgi:hypothetical protein
MDGIVIVAIAQEGIVGGGTGTENQSHLISAVTESLLVPYVNYLTFGIDIAAGLIIGLSAIFALISFFKILIKSIKEPTQYKDTIRLNLTRGMLLALDFVTARLNWHLFFNFISFCSKVNNFSKAITYYLLQTKAWI